MTNIASSLNYKWINKEKEGPVLLFLHEGLGSIKQWKDYPDLLCEEVNLSGLLYDRQGHGKSPALSEERDETYLEKYALEELPAFLSHINLTRDLILIGHSDGGTIALIYASKFPKQVKGIITEAAHIYVEPIT
ncbi:MAG: alpha/beta hydrolase [Flavobacteriales bacterium]|nr:alpha/beta hydrolase [Flavobacteriales bacterium]